MQFPAPFFHSSLTSAPGSQVHPKLRWHAPFFHVPSSSPQPIPFDSRIACFAPRPDKKFAERPVLALLWAGFGCILLNRFCVCACARVIINSGAQLVKPLDQGIFFPKSISPRGASSSVWPVVHCPLELVCCDFWDRGVAGSGGGDRGRLAAGPRDMSGCPALSCFLLVYPDV
jgi:hypothetical protein